MPRIGMNPNRGLKTSQLQARITLAALTYLPEEIGYFEHRFDVTRLCLESLIANTPQIYDLLVFDNGSCPLLVNYLEQLHAAGKIHYLLLSKKNIGKIAALQMICKAAPGEIIAYSDDDVFFLPGWLEAHLQIMESYPKVGLVTGFYIRSHMRYATRSLERFARQEDVQVERGNLVPVAVEQHYVENMGRTWQQYQAEVEGLQDLRFTYHDLPALASAGHHQFVARHQVILEALPDGNDGMLMGKMVELETRIDDLGYLRLSTNEPVTRLLGNEVGESMLEEAQKYGISTERYKPYQDQIKPGRLVTQSPLIRRFLQYLYNRLHHILYSNQQHLEQ
jgi:glycosyltransferase involved in cell wall biosynthesis